MAETTTDAVEELRARLLQVACRDCDLCDAGIALRREDDGSWWHADNPEDEHCDAHRIHEALYQFDQARTAREAMTYYAIEWVGDGTPRPALRGVLFGSVDAAEQWIANNDDRRYVRIVPMVRASVPAARAAREGAEHG